MERRLRVETRTRRFRPTPAIQAHVERELRRELGYVGMTAGEVVAFLTDVNGPRGGEDKRCQIRARLGSGGEAFASAVAADLYAAITKAARRLGRALLHAAGQGGRGRLARKREVHE